VYRNEYVYIYCDKYTHFYTHIHVEPSTWSLYSQYVCRVYTFLYICDIRGWGAWHIWSSMLHVSRIDQIIGLFCRISSLLQGSFAKETYDLIEYSQHLCCMYVNMYMCIEMCIYIYIVIYIQISIHTYTWSLYSQYLTRMCFNMYMCIEICIYVSRYIHTFLHTYTRGA